MAKNKKFILTAIFSIVFAVGLSAQVITTASAYFKTISDYYASFKDYEATIEITADKKEMAGKVSYKRPNLLRIDFANPENQVIVFNGDMLTIYLPEASAVLQQNVQADKNGASIATSQGLSLLSRYYSVAYEIGQEPVPLENGSEDKVIKLVLYPRNSAEAFRYIKIAISPETKLIRRIEASTKKGELFVFNFMDYKINTDITDQRFIYDAPSSANNYNNFLFSE